MQAAPCSSASTSAAATAAATPSQAEPLTDETAAAKKAAISILPSRPTSMMPLRSEKSPPMAQSTSGVATRRVAARVNRTRVAVSPTVALAPSRQQILQPGARQVREGAREQNHQPLDHHHHLAGDGRDLE